MKKLLLSAVAMIGLMPGFTSTASAELYPEDRTNWVITGCSQRPADAETDDDGDLSRIKDGNVNTYWHSYWSGHDAQNHFFVVDRGEALATTELSAVGYTPRQGDTGGNGYVTECDVYMLDSVDGLSLWSGEEGGWKEDGHSSLEAFIANETPTAHGSFDYTLGNAGNRGESKVIFDAPAVGRYILFVATKTVGSAGDQFANCAEFNAYVEKSAVKLPGSGLESVAELENGKEYLIYDAHSGRYGFHYVDVEDYSKVWKNHIDINATELLDFSYVWVAEQAEDGWKFVNKGTGKYIKTLSHWYYGTQGVDDNGGVFTVSYNEENSAFNLKNASDDNYWSGDLTYLAGDSESGKHDFKFIDVTPLLVSPVTVTFNFPELSGEVLSLTVSCAAGADATSVISSVAFFSDAAIVEEDKIVSKTNNTFTVTGTWTLPFELNKVYRMDLRQSSLHGCTNFYYNSATGQIETRNGTDADAFVPQRLFYLDGVGMSVEGVKVTLHTVATDVNLGFNVSADNNAIGSITESPTEFIVVTNATGSEGVSLRHPDKATSHANDIEGRLGIWQYAESQNDGGSYIRFKALSDADFDGLLSGDDAALFTEEAVAAAKASQSSADVRALFDNYFAYDVAAEEAGRLYSKVSVITPEHFGEELGYLTGSSYETIASLIATMQGAVNEKNVNAIMAAMDALNAELANLSANMPQAGKCYRFKGAVSGKYIAPTSDNGKMAMADEPNEASVFRFDATESENTFKPINSEYNVGIYGTHSLAATGEETYTFFVSEGYVKGAFTVKSNTTDGGQYLHDNVSTADRYSEYHPNCNWILEEVADSTSIEEIEVANPAVQGIYDLQGRKLSAPVKGINIINGKKVLVK